MCSGKNKSNVNIFFHRFENQGRHTVHMHLLVWLENLGSINPDRLRATIPDDDSQLVYLIRIFYHFLHLNHTIYIKNKNHFYHLFSYALCRYMQNFTSQCIYRLIFCKHLINETRTLQSTSWNNVLFLVRIMVYIFSFKILVINS